MLVNGHTIGPSWCKSVPKENGPTAFVAVAHKLSLLYAHQI